MHKLRSFSSVVVFMLAMTSLAAASQETLGVRKLFSELSQPLSTDAAAHGILELASRDPNARAYVAQRLPAMIKDKEVGPVWLNAVRLAGELKLPETIPALMEAFSRGGIGQGSVTISEYMRLDTDVVAKALAEIGDASVPVVAGLLRQDDKDKRHRAVLILLNINTPASKKALGEHLPNETDPDVKKLIQDTIR